jgi:hypothetical protein
MQRATMAELLPQKPHRSITGRIRLRFVLREGWSGARRACGTAFSIREKSPFRET